MLAHHRAAAGRRRPAGRDQHGRYLTPLAGDAARAVALWRRLLELSARYAQAAAVVTFDMLARDVSTLVHVAAPALMPTPGDIRDEQVHDRLRQLPAACGPRLLAAWRDSRELAWRLISSVTSVEDRPASVLRQWQTTQPTWLDSAPWQIQLAAGELASAYGAGALAADLYRPQRRRVRRVVASGRHIGYIAGRSGSWKWPRPCGWVAVPGVECAAAWAGGLEVSGDAIAMEPVVPVFEQFRADPGSL